MDKLFIETRYSFDCRLQEKDIRKLPDNLAVVGTVQYLDCVRQIKVQLAEARKKAVLPKLPHAQHKGQLLGCSISRIKGADAILFVGDGLFHPTAMQIKNKCDVFTYNPKNGAFLKLDPEAGRAHEKRIQGARLRFLSSRNVGILVSTKPGQNRIRDARKLKAKLAKKEINSYIFLSDSVNPPGLADFSFVDVFVNTACPRIFYDDYMKFPAAIINIDDVMDI
jgi:2-(3-amino-3-carboxypropyl)histidine synthase